MMLKMREPTLLKWRARLMPFVAEKFFFQMKTDRDRHNLVFSIRIGQEERVSTHRQIRLW